jgi:hypothetical protein
MSKFEVSIEELPGDIDWKDAIDFGLKGLSEDELYALFDNLAYQGFDPVLVRRMALSLGNIKEIVQLLLLSIRQGTNTEKLSSSLSTEGQIIVRALQAKFKLSSINGSESKVPRQVLTIQRLQSAFPELVASLLVRLSVNRSFKTIGSSSEEMENYPYLCFASAPSIIPHDDKDSMDNWKEWSKTFSRVINRKKKDYNYDDQDDFAQIIHDSPLFSDDQRKEIMKTLRKEHAKIKRTRSKKEDA